MEKQTDTLPAQTTAAPLRAVFFVLGVLFFALAIVGVILPGMPTTVFVLLAAYCWARSSRRVYAWLLSHRLFGKMIIDWQERRAMPRFAKRLAWTMMAASTAVLAWRLPSERLWVAAVVAAVSLATAIWMARLPDA